MDRVVFGFFRSVVAGEPAGRGAALATPPAVVGLFQNQYSRSLDQRELVLLLRLVVILYYGSSYGCGSWKEERPLDIRQELAPERER